MTTASGKAVRDRPIVVYDSTCGLCNRSVAFILHHERDSQLQFAAQSSPAGQQLLRKFGLEREARGTMILIVDGRCFVRSTGVLRICRHLRRPWRWGIWLLALPRVIRDAIYRMIAAHRHSLFRRHSNPQTWPLPRNCDRARFLDQP